MPSRSLSRWRNESATALDEIEAAHAAVGGMARGRRYATQQINQAYVMLLSSRFQRFCRDLHSEAVAQLIQTVPVPLQAILQKDWTTGRKLDQGNPNPGNIGSDFARLGMALWDDVYPMHAWNKRRREYLNEMMVWRNAIGHQDFNKSELQGRTEIHLTEIRRYRSVCGALAGFFDCAVLAHIQALAGPTAGW